jgi:Zn-dependent protease with chaperone function
MPLWTILSGPERIALLGHELGHQVNGDPGHGCLAGSARRSLRQWMVLLNPRTAPYERRVRPARGSGIAGIATLLAPLAQVIVFLPCYLVAWGCDALLTRLDLSCGQRAEYLADELGARLGGSEAAGGLLGKLPLGEPVGTFLLAKRNAQGTARRAGADQDGQPDPWESLREFVNSIPETERQRRRIVDKARNTRTDSTHPANHLRASLMHERPQHAGTIKLSEDEWAEIDAELAPAGRAVAKRLLGR